MDGVHVIQKHVDQRHHLTPKRTLNSIEEHTDAGNLESKHPFGPNAGDRERPFDLEEPSF